MRKKTTIYILGLNQSHNATAALLKNGKIISCISEERLTRKKNYQGYPKLAIKYLLHQEGIKTKDISLVALNFKSAIHYAIEKNAAQINFLYNLINLLTYKFKILNYLFRPIYQIYQKSVNRLWYLAQIRKISHELKLSPEKIVSYPHHLTHASSVVYGLGAFNNKVLVLTNDGAGDQYCTSVNIYDQYHFKEIAHTTNNASLAGMYGAITSYMGMKVNEHEYKVMGLAPYTNPQQDGVTKTVGILSDIFRVSNLHIESKIDARHYPLFLEEKMRSLRFDWIAYSAQKVTEDKLIEWVSNCVKETKIDDVYCAGGIFMNVKANKAILELPCVKKLTVMPSSADESTAIGAAYMAYVDYCTNKQLPIKITPLTHLYLGNQYRNSEIKKFINKYKLNKEFTIKKVANPELVVAQLLAKGEIVARFSGPMEFGQRALGNRSILANPSKKNVVREINDRIKSRDFWMPFAGSILAEDEKDYIINPKKIKAYYMILSFDTTQKAKEEIFSSLHPYDHTIRPQIVERTMNPKYHYLITEFKKLTKIGVVLNTSFNLHGEPIVCSIKDAIHTLRESDLKYLQIENYLIKKN